MQQLAHTLTAKITYPIARPRVRLAETVQVQVFVQQEGESQKPPPGTTPDAECPRARPRKNQLRAAVMRGSVDRSHHCTLKVGALAVQFLSDKDSLQAQLKAKEFQKHLEHRPTGHATQEKCGTQNASGNATSNKRETAAALVRPHMTEATTYTCVCHAASQSTSYPHSPSTRRRFAQTQGGITE